MPNDLSPWNNPFTSFNARNLSARQVAESFIPPSHFEDLIGRQNSLVVGPRGSGKTTLLKMLQLPALAEWTHPDAERIRNTIDFVGVFVPSDVSWGAQIDNLGGETLPTHARNVLGKAAFTTHILTALTDSMRYCASEKIRTHNSLSRLSISLSREQESCLVRDLATAWQLIVAVPSLAAIKLALKSRLAEIALVAERLSLLDEESALRELSSQSYLLLDAIRSVDVATTAFGLIGDREDMKWGLLFDELEIAPHEIQRTLWKQLRSGSHHLLFKLSVSPFGGAPGHIDKGSGPAALHDFKKIELWYPRKEANYAFSEALVASLIKRAGLPSGTSPDQLFGESEFDAPVGSGRNQTYSPGGKAHDKFLRLEARDETFRDYLGKHGIKLNDLSSLSGEDRAEVVRRATSVVVVREAFRGQARGTPNTVSSASGRSRKNPDIYSGANALFAIAEGNPRWLINLFSPLINSLKGEAEVIDRARQSAAVQDVSHAFRAYISTIPYKRGSKSLGLLSLLDQIGHAMHRGVVADKFTPQPPLSFKIDEQCDAEMTSALSRALNAGAIIYVPHRGDEPVMASLKGKRFRLSYMLAAHYRLPLILGIEVSLTNLLKRAPNDGRSDLFESDG